MLMMILLSDFIDDFSCIGKVTPVIESMTFCMSVAASRYCLLFSDGMMIVKSVFPLDTNDI